MSSIVTAGIVTRNLVDGGHLRHDVYQEKVASQLEDLLGRLEQQDKEMHAYHVGFMKLPLTLLLAIAFLCSLRILVFSTVVAHIDRIH